MTATLDRIILSNPSLLDATSVNGVTPAKSWIQLAKTGSFVSNRYGKFDITREDLSQMLFNFQHITPQAPTMLPVDFDHLSMAAAKVGDGVAAGWMKQLELRDDGESLWGLVEWTPDAAVLIKNRAYQFVSPSFVKNHQHTNGEDIGTTLLAAAITNHPFLHGMAALTLYNFSALGDLALTDRPTPQTRHLAEVRQRVSFKEDPELTPELTDEERRAVYEVKATAGVGEDAFARLVRLDTNEEFGWFRTATQLAAAAAPEKDQHRPLPPQPPKETQPMPTQTQSLAVLESQAAAFAALVQSLSSGRTAAEAVMLAARQDRAGAEAYRLAGIGLEMAPEPEPVLSLSVRAGESFDDLVRRHVAEKGVSWREAVHEVGRQYPELAAAR